MHKLRIAMVGCGRVAVRFHLPALASSAYATLAAVVDADPLWASEVGRRFGAGSVLTDYRDLRGRVDAAVVATPNHTHAEISAWLLAQGISVLCEKPMACTAEQARAMIAAERGGGRLTVAHNCRFTPNMQEAKRLVDQGHLGVLQEMSGALGAPRGTWRARTDFRERPDLAGGGVLIDLGVHLIDLSCWLFGNSVSALSYAASDQAGIGVETEAEVALGFAGGGQALLSCSAIRTLDRVVRLRGSEGWLAAPVEGAEIAFSFRGARACRVDGAQRLLLEPRDGFQAQIDHFSDAVLHDRPFLVSVDDALRTVELVERCYGEAKAA